ncbi:MAG: hypothetical protein OCD01_17335 [Fibrobacterales bacterium]
MKKQLATMISIALISGMTLSGCDLFDKAKEAAQEANLDEALETNDAESEECNAYMERYRTMQDEEALTMYQKYCLKDDAAADAQAEESRPESIKTDERCGELYDRAYIMADSIYFENAETCDFNVTQVCKDLMQPVKDIVKRILNECGVQQSEIYVRRFIEAGAAPDMANCTFPMYIPSDNKSIEVKCQENPSCEAVNGKHQERWTKADGTGDVFVPCAVECPQGYFFDMYTEECVYDNYAGYGTACDPSEYVAPDGTCKPNINCAEGQYTDFATGTCMDDPWYCPMGYFKPYEGAPCEEDVWAKTCDNGGFRDAAGNCVTVQCNWDQYYDDATGACMTMQQCGPNQSWSYMKGECVTFQNCGPNEWFDIEMGECQQDYSTGCGTDEMWSWEQNRCITLQQCGPGEYFDVGRGHCRVDDKPFNDMVVRSLTPYCSDLYLRMDGPNEDETSMQSFLRDCIGEFVAITLPQGPNEQCRTLYTGIMNGMAQYFGNATCSQFDGDNSGTPPQECMDIMNSFEPKMGEFKSLECGKLARDVDPYWVFLADDGGDNGGDGGPQCPEGTRWNEDYDYCEPEDFNTIQCPEGFYFDQYEKYCREEGTYSDQCGEGMYWDDHEQMCKQDGHDNGFGDKVSSRLVTQDCKNLFSKLDGDGGFNPENFTAFVDACDGEFRAAVIDQSLPETCKVGYNTVISTFIEIASGECSMYMGDDDASDSTMGDIPANCETLFNTMMSTSESLCEEAFNNPEYPFILD